MDKLIYIAEDEKHIQEIEKIFLEKSGFRVEVFATGEELLKAFEQKMADLLVLDIMLPGMDGLTLCGLIREKSNVPIIIVSAKDTDIDRITGITLGSDDYITKPFSPVELVVRVQAIFRRMEMSNNKAERPANVFKFADLEIDKKLRSVTKNGKEINLTQMEYEVLIYLIEHQDEATSRVKLLQTIWHFHKDGIDTRATDDTMKRLRKKLYEAGSSVHIETVRGFGFRIGFDGDE